MENGAPKTAEDKISCIRVPPLVTVKTWKHGVKTHTGQVQYKNKVNTKTTPEFFPVAPEEQDFGGIEAIGDVFNVTAEIAGTEADAADMECSASPASLTCSGNDACSQSMDNVKACGRQNSNTLACVAQAGFVGAKALTMAWTSLARCYGQALAKRSHSLFSVFSKGRFGRKDRRLASGVTAAVRITTGGNNGLIGTPSSSASAQVPPAATATGKFATSSGTSGAAGGAGMGAGMTALVALVSVGAVVGAAVGLKKRQSGADMTAFTPGASKELTNKGAAKEDMTDVL
jgi:hypothetical protein